jgi:hypothetical protein
VTPTSRRLLVSPYRESPLIKSGDCLHLCQLNSGAVLISGLVCVESLKPVMLTLRQGFIFDYESFSQLYYADSSINLDGLR